jgi:hypothetical protein
MNECPISRDEYVSKVLNAYCHTPGTSGFIRREDRFLAEDLYQRGVPLNTVEDALVLAAARRTLRRSDVPQLSTIRSLHYFVPVIDEVLELSAGSDYYQYLRGKIERYRSSAVKR